MCAGGGDRLSTFIPVLLPPSSITRLIFPSPLPQSLRNLQRLLSAAHQTGLFFYIGLCETFSGISDWWGCILLPAPPFLIFFLKTKFFCIFHNAFGWGQCHQQAGLPPSILLASSLHPPGFFLPSSWLPLSILWAAHTVLLWCCCSPFPLSSFLLDPQQCSPESSRESPGHVPWG